MTRASKARPISRDLRLRIGSAAVMVPAVVLLTLAGTAPFAAVAAAVAFLAFREWLAMLGADRPGGLLASGGVLIALLAVAALLLPLPAALTVVFLFALLAGRIGRATGAKRPMRRGAGLWSGVGFVYVGLPLVAFVGAREGEHGVAVVFFLIVTAAAADTAAYFVGRAVGGPRLWPRVSPGKTWSGFVGGLCGGVAAGLAVAFAGGLPVTAATGLLALFLAVVAAFGDLLESAVKRHFGIKDASHLIPGHGGVMDRVDGIAAAAVAALLVGAASGPALPPSDALVGLMAGG